MKKPVPHKVDAPTASDAVPASVAVSATPVHATPASAKKSVQNKVNAPKASVVTSEKPETVASPATPVKKKTDTHQPAKKTVPHKVDAPVVSNAEPASVAVSATPVHATPASAAQSTLEKRRPVTNGEQVEITRDFVTKRTNVYGTPETFILIERTNVPGKVLTPAQLDALIEKAQ